MYDEFHVPDVFIVLLYGVHLKTKLSRVLINKKQSYNFRCAISRNYNRQLYKHIHVVHPICPTCGSSSVKNPELFICFLAITSLALLCWLLSGFFVLIVLRHSWVSQVFTPSISRLARCCSLFFFHSHMGHWYKRSCDWWNLTVPQTRLEPLPENGSWIMIG